MKKVLLFCGLIGAMGSTTDLSCRLYAQSENSNWTKVSQLKSNYKIAEEQMVYSVDLEDIMRQLSLKAGSNESIGFPLGARANEMQFLIRKNEVLIPSLAVLNPQIQTYEGVSTDKSAQIRITASPYGLNVKISLKGGEVYYIQPVSKEEPNVLVSYNARTLMDKTQSACGDVEKFEMELTAARPVGPVPVRTCELKKYVLAVAATGEYTNWAGGQAQALAKITASVNNVNLVFETDMGIRFVLNSPSQILFTNPATDPYVTTNVVNNAILTANHDTLTSLLGVNGFDIGHVVNEGWAGGVAGLRSACTVNWKGRGGTGLPTNPTGYDFDMIFAHEIGHQLGAEHTFSASNGNCGSNISIASSWEAGGGSTIMGYTAICVNNFYQWHRSDFFHAGSIEQMTNHLLINHDTCGVRDINHPNTQTFSDVLQHSYLVPASTPFKLSLIANDATNNGLTYTWDQMNSLDTNSTSGTPYPPSPTAVTGPLFRSYDPDVSETRYFPRLEKIASGDLTYEVLPTISREMDFRGTVRDNYPGGGCISAQDVKVTTNADCSMYITSHTTAQDLGANGTHTTTLTWNPASCVPCEYVNVKFSVDSGKTYPYLLGTDPNDGHSEFNVPNLPTCNGRFMIECASNIFFNVSSADLTILNSSTCNPGRSVIAPATPVAESVGSSNLNLSMAPVYGNPVTISGVIENTDIEGSLVILDPNVGSCFIFSNSTYNDVFSFVPSKTGTYTFECSSNTSMILNVYKDEFDANLSCNNFITSSALRTGSSTFSALNQTVSVDLCANSRYVLVVSKQYDPTSNASTNYSVSVSGPGTLYTDYGTPDANYVYKYVIVGSDNLIKDIQSTPNLSNPAIFVDDDYKIYGLSGVVDVYELWIGYHINLMKQYSYMGWNLWCMALSDNYRSVKVGSGALLSQNNLSLSAQFVEDKKALVIWKVINDVNVGHYELERSYDGLTFEKLHTATGKNYTNEGSYIYSDESFNTKQDVIYYRVKSVAKDGSFSYSSVVKVSRMLQRARRSQQITIAPNPIKNDEVIVNLDGLMEDEYEASIYDVAGRLIKKQKIDKKSGVQVYIIDVRGILSGVYFLKLTGNNLNTQVRFVKQ